MTCDGYTDGELVKVIEWPPLSDCVTVTPDESAEVKAVFHMLGETEPVTNQIAGLSIGYTAWPSPNSNEPEKPADEVSFDFGMHMFDEMQKPTVLDKLRESKQPEAAPYYKVGFWVNPKYALKVGRREPSKCAKPAISGLTQTAGEGRYQGLGFNSEA